MKVTYKSLKDVAFHEAYHGRPEAAFAALDAVLAADPLDLDARFLAADVFAKLQIWDALEKTLVYSIEIAMRAGHPLAAIHLLHTLEKLGRDADPLWKKLAFLYSSDSTCLSPSGSRIAPLPDEGHRPPPLALLWHDRQIVFANKPTGQLAHQAGKQLSGTLLNQLQDWAAAQGIDPNEVRLINRIDRETSGIVIATLDLAAHQALAAQLDARAIRKAYRAICVGVSSPADGNNGRSSASRLPRMRGRCAKPRVRRKRPKTPCCWWWATPTMSAIPISTRR